jgi:uncharacterized SAM-dependent methyltransferase
LKKTGHLLTALASTIPSSISAPAPPITYLPLDLSRPELARTLSQLDSTVGSRLAGKVEYRGLWGDYERGIEFIKRGGLREMRRTEDGQSSGGSSSSSGESSPMPGTPEEVGGNKDLPPTPPDSCDEDGMNDSGKPPFDRGMDVSATGKIRQGGGGGGGGCNDGGVGVQGQEETTTTTNVRPLHLLFLGSSLGNFDRSSAVPFLASLPLRPGKGDTLLLGLDGRPAANGTTPTGEPDYSAGKRQVEAAYNDAKGITRDFIMHGLDVADAELRGLSLDSAKNKGQEGRVIDKDKWEYAARYNVPMGRHEAYYRSRVDQTISLDMDGTRAPKINIDKGELLNIEWSYKVRPSPLARNRCGLGEIPSAYQTALPSQQYSPFEALDLFEKSNLRVIQSWKDPGSEYRLYLLERPPFHFPLLPSLSTRGRGDQDAQTMPRGDERRGEWPSVPTKAEWHEQWKFWDT